ncbi:hypothetical protein RFI_25270 [Reticulomyxa filosa]|uniref:Kelch motif family protein n=1 Tax=Reticulomyxa filosa TaxID=46433 RepID=X6MGC6_RETFI|nr:hypothetical protein RFI_25270 [Reticulomyxa filosa]|eukprot:ETO12105.1 hypothetical protein RFI_25270 [Reticulomyxa filosa]
MGNRTTTQKLSEKETKQSRHLITPFQTLKDLPTLLSRSQCVLHKHELLICGGYEQRACYSYHILKNEYKFICEYLSDIKLNGHCVVKLVDSSNQITLLSFGSDRNGKNKHTLVMKYVSVWNDTSNKSNELNNYNQWVSFTDNHNHPIIIGRDEDYYTGVRAVIGGSNNHLLFITYFIDNISIWCHCFVLNSENRQEQKMMKTNQEKNKQQYQMLLFCEKEGLSIEYNEDYNTFQFHQLPIYKDIAIFSSYAYVCINDVILFFGGYCYNYGNAIYSKSVHRYSIRESKWITFQNILPRSLYDCVAILSEDDNRIHIIGGKDDKDTTVSTHMKTEVRVWDPLLLVMICLFIYYFDETQKFNCLENNK